VEDTLNETLPFLIHPDFLLVFGCSLVFSRNGILQENNLLADFGFLLLKGSLSLYLPFRLFDTFLRLIKFCIAKE